AVGVRRTALAHGPVVRHGVTVVTACGREQCLISTIARFGPVRSYEPRWTDTGEHQRPRPGRPAPPAGRGAGRRGGPGPQRHLGPLLRPARAVGLAGRRRAADEERPHAAAVGDRAGAAALIIGTDPDTPAVAARVTALADRLGLPVLRVPYSVSFIVLSRTVADALIHEESRRLARASRIYASIRDGITASDPARFLARLEAELGCELFVIDSGTGASVLDGTPPPPGPVRDELLATLSRRGGAVPGLLRADAGDGQVVAVEVPYEEPTLLVARRPGAGDQPFDLALLQHAATAAAVEVAHASLRQDHHRQLGTELLAQLLDSRLDAASAGRQLAARGLDPAGARLLAARGPADDDQRRLHIGLHRRHVDHLLIRRGGVVLILLAGTGTGTGTGTGAGAGRADETVALVRGRLGGDSAVGVSNVLGDALRVPEAAREAMWALAVAAERPDGAAHYGGAAPLPALRDPAEAQALIDRALGLLLD